jgi:hypothetical protein
MAVTKTQQYKDAIVDIWDLAQNTESSRAGLMEALDSIQESCVEAVPDVEELASPDTLDEDVFDEE